MAEYYDTIYLPTRPQPDTVIAIFLLKTYGEDAFPGVKDAEVKVMNQIPEGKTEEDLEQEGDILLDVGGGKFDHHGSNETASQLVAEYLGIDESPAVAKLLRLAERDDKHGKGTVSSDPLDRAFGFPGLLASLNKSLPNDPNQVVRIMLPVLWGHHTEEYSRTVETPEEFYEKDEAGEVVRREIHHKERDILMVALHSDNASMPGWLRSQKGLEADVVIQRQEGGHTNILTRSKYIDLRLVVALIRKLELKKKGEEAFLPMDILKQEGRLKEVGRWYYDRSTNSFLNGGVIPEDTKPTQLSFEEIVSSTEKGLRNLEVGG